MSDVRPASLRHRLSSNARLGDRQARSDRHRPGAADVRVVVHDARQHAQTARQLVCDQLRAADDLSQHAPALTDAARQTRLRPDDVCSAVCVAAVLRQVVVRVSAVCACSVDAVDGC